MRIKLKEHDLASKSVAREFASDIETLIPSLENKYAQIVRALISTLNTHPDLMQVKPLLGSKDYPDIDFPPMGSELDIEVYLANNLEQARDIFVEGLDSPDWLGKFFMLSHDMDENDENECYLANAFRIIVSVDESHLIQWAQEQLEDWGEVDIDEVVEMSLVTLTHEVMHVRDFIAHAHGLTPHQVEKAWDDSLFDYSPQDVVTGLYIRQDMSGEEMDNEQAVEVMEDRVEIAGRRLLQDCLNDPDFAKSVEDYKKAFSEAFDQNQQNQQSHRVASARPDQG